MGCLRKRCFDIQKPIRSKLSRPHNLHVWLVTLRGRFNISWFQQERLRCTESGKFWPLGRIVSQFGCIYSCRPVFCRLGGRWSWRKESLCRHISKSGSYLINFEYKILGCRQTFLSSRCHQYVQVIIIYWTLQIYWPLINL